MSALGWGAAAGGLLGLLKAPAAKKKYDQQMRLARTMARWSPYTGNQSWLQLAQAQKPSTMNALTQGALQGMQVGHSLSGLGTQQGIQDLRLQQQQQNLDYMRQLQELQLQEKRRQLGL